MDLAASRWSPVPAGEGGGIALRLAWDGLDVAVNEVEANSAELDSVAREIRDTGRQTATVPADVSVPREVESMVGQVVEKLGGLNVMVANAGIAQVAPLLELGAEDRDRVMDVNARGVFLCYQEAARQMNPAGYGRQNHRRGLHRRAQGFRAARALLSIQVGGAQPYPGRRPGVGTLRHYNQRLLPRHSRYRDVGAHRREDRRDRRLAEGRGA